MKKINMMILLIALSLPAMAGDDTEKEKFKDSIEQFSLTQNQIVRGFDGQKTETLEFNNLRLRVRPYVKFKIKGLVGLKIVPEVEFKWSVK